MKLLKQRIHSQSKASILRMECQQKQQAGIGQGIIPRIKWFSRLAC